MEERAEKIRPVALGLISDPPTLVLCYEVVTFGGKNDEGKVVVQKKVGRRKRKMPLRDFSDRSNVTRTAFLLRQRQQEYLKDVLPVTLEKMLRIIQELLKGLSKEDAVEKVSKEYVMDPNEDLNQLLPQDLTLKKSIMDEGFRKNLVLPGDPHYSYDCVVEIDAEALEPCGWDEENNENAVELESSHMSCAIKLDETFGSDNSPKPKGILLETPLASENSTKPTDIMLETPLASENSTKPTDIMLETPFASENSTKPADIMLETPFASENSTKPADIMLETPFTSENSPKLTDIMLETPFASENSTKPADIMLETPFASENSPMPTNIMLETQFASENIPKPMDIMLETPFASENIPNPSSIMLKTPFVSENIPNPTSIMWENPFASENTSHGNGGGITNDDRTFMVSSKIVLTIKDKETKDNPCNLLDMKPVPELSENVTSHVGEIEKLEPTVTVGEAIKPLDNLKHGTIDAKNAVVNHGTEKSSSEGSEGIDQMLEIETGDINFSDEDFWT